MELNSKIAETEQKFEQLRAERDTQLNIIKDAENKSAELLAEMTKLQGAYQVLVEVQASIKPNKKAKTIEVVPEEIEK